MISKFYSYSFYNPIVLSDGTILKILTSATFYCIYIYNMILNPIQNEFGHINFDTCQIFNNLLNLVIILKNQSRRFCFDICQELV